MGTLELAFTCARRWRLPVRIAAAVEMTLGCLRPTAPVVESAPTCPTLIGAPADEAHLEVQRTTSGGPSMLWLPQCGHTWARRDRASAARRLVLGNPDRLH